jgi:DNA-binding NtrC family response regulator
MASVSETVTILVIDDIPENLDLLKEALTGDGIEILTATDPECGLDLLRDRHPQIVITDLVMPKYSGMDVLEQAMEFDPSIEVIIMTAHYSTESAVEAIKKGACDYLNKPVRIQTIRERVQRLLTRLRAQKRVKALESEIAERAQFEGLIGNSSRMWDLFSRIERIAPHYRAVLVTGPTGTGKELVARALHKLSPVRNANFVVLNCSAVVETLFESELFGHVRGSFTGASHDKMGLIEVADGGTLFLDEIGDMPLGTQAKLLRALQNQEVQRVGSLAPRKVDVRVIAATNRNLREAVQHKEFREDLYYRLAMVEIHTPSLAEREGDIVLLQNHFLEKFARQFRKDIRGITRRAQFILQRWHWPGNVRELENAIGHACMMVLGDTIDVEDLPTYLSGTADPEETTLRVLQFPSESPRVPSEPLALEEQEKRLIVQALDQSHGNQVHAARLLRISRDALRYRMKKHGILPAGSSSAAEM